MIETTVIESTDHWQGRESIGKRVILEGCHQDTTSFITIVATVLRPDLGNKVDMIEIDGINFRSWPGRPPAENSLVFGYRDIPYLTDLGQIRSMIIEDGRIFVAEGKLHDREYVEQFLRPAIRYSAQKFGQCAGTGFFHMLIS